MWTVSPCLPSQSQPHLASRAWFCISIFYVLILKREGEKEKETSVYCSTYLWVIWFTHHSFSLGFPGKAEPELTELCNCSVCLGRSSDLRCYSSVIIFYLRTVSLPYFPPHFICAFLHSFVRKVDTDFVPWQIGKDCEGYIPWRSLYSPEGEIRKECP